MTLLSIAQAAADEVQIIRPGSIVGNVNDDARRFLRYANKVGTRLMKAYPWQALRKETTFTATGTETQSSVLASDFDRMVAETFWNRTGRVLVTGPVSPVRWNGLKAGDSGGTPRRFILRGNAILTAPAFAGGESCAFEYVSDLWVDTDGDGAGDASSWQADDDTALIDEELILYGIVYEWLASEELDSAALALKQYTDYFNLLVGNDQPSADILLSADIFGGGRHFSGEPQVGGGGSDLF